MARFFVVSFFFVMAVPILESGGKVLEVMAAGTLVVIVEGTTMVIGLVIAEEPEEVVVLA